MIVCVIPAVPQEGSLQVKVFVDNLRIGTCGSCYVYFSYWNTPQLAYMIPFAANPGDEINYYGKPVVSTSTDIDFIKIGDFRCDASDQNEFDAVTFSSGNNQAPCNVSTMLEAGYYPVTEKSKNNTGYAKVLNTAYNFKFDGEPYNFAVVPKISSISNNVGSSQGQIITVKGVGFSSSEQNSVSVASIPCTILSQSSTEIQCELQAGTVSADQGYHAGLKLEYFFDKSIDNVKAGALNDISMSRLVSEIPKDYADSYTSKLSGYFKAPVTGQYKFAVAADDKAQLYFSTTPLDTTTAILLVDIGSYSSYKYFFTKGLTQISSEVSLTEGEYYYFYLLHQEGSGSDHASLGVYIPSTTNTVSNVPEAQSIAISCGSRDMEVIEFKVSATGGKWKIRFDTLSSDGKKITSTYNTSSMNYNEGNTSVSNQIRWTNGNENTVVRTMLASDGTETTDTASAATYVYTVTFIGYRTNGILPSIIADDLTGTSVSTKVTQIQAPSSPVRGSFIVGRGGLTASLNYNAGTYDVESAMRTLGFHDPIRVTVSGDVNVGYEWRIQFTGEGSTDIDTLTVTNSLTGCKDSSVDIAVTTLQDSSQDLFYEVIPSDLLFTAESNPQVTVISNGVQGNCPGFNCDYVIQDTGLPQITAASYSSSTLTLSVTGVTQGDYNDDDLRVFFGNTECIVSSYTDSSSPATVVADCPTPEAGTHYPRVHFDGLGFAEIDSGVTSIEVLIVISSISPTEYNPNGGTTFTVTGTGFPASLAAATARGMTLLIGTAVCEATSVSATQITCVNEIVSTPEALTVTLNGESESSQALTELATTPSITTVSPDSVNPVLQTDITITGTNFDASSAQTSVYLGNSTNNKVQECLVTDSNTTQITCKLLGAPTGTYDFYVQTSQGYTNSVNFAVKTVITSISPTSGSLAGGTLLTISGEAFSNQITQTLVFIGDENLACDVVSSSATAVTCTTRASTSSAYLETPQTVYVDTRIVEEAICEGSCSFTYTDSLTPKITSVTSSVAPGGSITIAGSGLDSEPTGTAPTVTINGVECTVTANSESSITATVPSGIVPSKTSALLVTVSGKGYANYTSGATGTIEVKPSLTSITPTTISTAGALVTINGAGFQTGAVVKIGSKECQIRSLTSTTIVCKTPSSGELSLNYNEFTNVKCSSSCYLSTSSSSTPTVSSVTPTTSSSSAFSITITGTKFDLGTVAVNLVLQTNPAIVFAASITSSSSTSIVAAFADVAAGVYNVEAVSANNIATSSATVTVSLSASSTAIESSIAGGATLSITGDGFFGSSQSSLNQVTVCGFPCEIIDSTSSTINCKTPQFINAAVLDTYTTLASAPVVLTGATWSDAKTEASVFDMTFTTVYTSSNTACEIGLDLGEHLQGQLSSIKFFPNPAIKGYTLNGTVIEGSDDNSTYTTVATIDMNAHDGWNTISFADASTPIRYRYYRLSGSQSSAKCALSELQYNGILISDSSITDLTALTCTAKVTVNGVTQETASTAVTYTSAKTATLDSISPPHGTSAGGDTLTLTGSGFSDVVANVAVYIDGVACTVQTASTTEITCTTGAAPEISNRRSSLESELSISFTDQGDTITNGIKYFYVDKWSDESTWGGITPPREGDSVSIPAGQTILLDVSPPKLKAIIIEGALIFDDANIDLHCDYIIIRNGRLQIGTWENPIQNKISVTLYGTKDSPQLPTFGNKVIAMMEGILDIHGKPRSHTWTMLESTANVGDTSIVVQGSVDWAIGEEIVIASTDHDHYQSEARTIATVTTDSPSSGQSTITFTDPLKFRHYAGIQDIDGVSFEMRAEVGLLTRNVVIQGDDQSQKLQYGVHIMAHSDTGDDSSIGRISYTEVRQAGQAFNLGRYPIHFHLIGNVRQSYVIGNAIHHTYNRAVTIHGVHYLTIQKNFAYWVMGHTIFIEDGIETHNLIEDNLVINTMASTALLNTDQTPASFWITNPNNIWRRNHAAGSDRYGFWFDLRAHPEGPSATDSICPTGERLGEFTDNQAHSSGRYGLRIFHELTPRTYPCLPIQPYEDNPPIPAEFTNFLGWKNMRNAIIGETLGAVSFKNIKAADNLRAGIEISDANASPYGTLFVEDAWIVGTTPDNGDDWTIYRDHAVQGLITPRKDNFLAKNVHFYNYGDGMTAIETCSHCEHPAATDAGARTSFFEGLTFTNVSQRVRFNVPYKEILIDLDGSLTGNSVNGTVTFYYEHLDVPGCTRDETVYNGLVCDDSVMIRRVEFYAANPTGNFKMEDLNIFRNEDNANGDMGAIKYRIKNDSWAVPFVTGYSYNLSWASRGDFSSVSFSPSELIQPYDKTITLVFNHSEYRETFDISGYTNTSLIPNVTLEWDPETDNTQFCGDWYHDVENQMLHIAVNAREQQDIKISSVKCRLNCPPTSGAVEKEGIVRLWSNATQWPGGVVPVDGQSVVIPGDWVLKLDVNTSSLGLLHILGDLHFDAEQPSLVLTAQRIWVEGQLFIGNSTEERYENNAKILLTGTRKSTSLIIGEIQDVSNKVLAVTGNVTMYGAEVNYNFVRLQASAQVNDMTITVPNTVDWKVGDEIFIAPTQRISKEYETHTITAISGGVITLDSKIKYYHFGASTVTKQTSYGLLDMRAEVGLLTRNIKIQGSDEDYWGGRLYVGEVYNSTYDTYYRGRVDIDAVEFINCGQANTTLAGVTLERLVSDTNDASVIRKSVLRDSAGYQLRVIGSEGFTFADNIVYKGYKYQAVFEESGSDIQFLNNLIVGTNDRGLKADKGDMAFDYTVNLFADVQFENSLFSGNIIAGCDQTCVLMPGSSCSGDKHFINNVVHSGETGWVMRAKNTQCTAATKLVGYKLEDALVSFFATQNIQASNLVISDSAIGCSLNIGKITADTTISITDSYFAGLSLTSYADAYTNKTECSALSGIMIPVSLIGEKSVPPSPSSLPWHKVKSDAIFKSSTTVSSVTFENFKDGLVTGCKGNYAFESNPYASDKSSNVKTSSLVLTNVDTSNTVFYNNPDDEWIGIDDCGGWFCTGIKNILIRDLDGTLSGGSATSLIPSIPGIYDGNTCTSRSDANTFACGTTGWGMLVFDSQDVDALTRILSPINITNSDGYSNGLNNFMDHLWDGFYTSLKRLSRYPAAVQTGKDYIVKFTSTIPNSVKWQLQGALTDEGITVQYGYQTPQSVKIVNKDGTNIPQKYKKSANDPATVGSSDTCGTNTYDLETRKITLKLSGDESCQLVVSLVNSIQASIRYAVTIEEFFNQDGPAAFIDKVAAVLNINPASIRIVSIKSGSTIIDYSIDSNYQGTDSTTRKNAETELQGWVAKLNAGVKDGSMKILNSKILNSSASYSLIGDEETSSEDSLSKSEKVIIIVAGVVGFAALSIGIYFAYIKLVKKNVVKSVVTKTPAKTPEAYGYSDIHSAQQFNSSVNIDPSVNIDLQSPNKTHSPMMTYMQNSNRMMNPYDQPQSPDVIPRSNFARSSYMTEHVPRSSFGSDIQGMDAGNKGDEIQLRSETEGEINPEYAKKI